MKVNDEVHRTPACSGQQWSKGPGHLWLQLPDVPCPLHPAVTSIADALALWKSLQQKGKTGTETTEEEIEDADGNVYSASLGAGWRLGAQIMADIRAPNAILHFYFFDPAGKKTFEDLRRQGLV